VTGVPAVTSPRVLVVEDDISLRNAVAGAVRGAGYRVTEAADGQAAVRELRSNRYDLVLLDLGLPFIDGWEVLHGLEGQRIPSVVVISGLISKRLMSFSVKAL